MTPEEKQRLQYAITEIASILYKNTSPKAIENLEGIEKTVREQMLEHVSPKIAFFSRVVKLAGEKARLEVSCK